MACKNATVRGTINAEKGTIGEWSITNNRLQNSDGSIYLSTTSGLKVGDNFKVTQAGKMTVKNADITGKITADEGTIGGWTITDSSLRNSTNSIYLSITNGLKVGRNFSVDTSGYMTVKNADITGSIYADYISANDGTIGGWAITSNGLYSDDVTLSSSGGITAKEVTIQTRTVDYSFNAAGQITGVTVTDQNNIGTIGTIEGDDGQQTTYNIGISSEYQRSIILHSKRNVALQAPYASIVLGWGWNPGDDATGSLRCVIKKENQHGIYARFA